MSILKRILYIIMPILFLIASNYDVTARPFGVEESILFWLLIIFFVTLFYLTGNNDFKISLLLTIVYGILMFVYPMLHIKYIANLPQLYFGLVFSFYLGNFIQEIIKIYKNKHGK